MRAAVKRSSTARIDLLAFCALLAPWLAAWLLPPFAQPQSYHQYADQLSWFGLPHAADALSNVVFLIAGATGLYFTLRGWRAVNPRAFAAPRAAWPYMLLFFGVVLTAFGSAWYHRAPTDATLVWDRLPMALAFAGLVAGTLSDRAPHRTPLLLIALCVTGAGAVLYWHFTGNLVPYLAMQAGVIVAALLATAMIPARYTHANRVYAAAGLYALALVCERLDHQLHSLLGGWVSGHTLKHLVASAAIFAIYSMLRTRSAIYQDTRAPATTDNRVALL